MVRKDCRLGFLQLKQLAASDSGRRVNWWGESLKINGRSGHTTTDKGTALDLSTVDVRTIGR
jgi:hypothetical protein